MSSSSESVLQTISPLFYPTIHLPSHLDPGTPPMVRLHLPGSMTPTVRVLSREALPSGTLPSPLRLAPTLPFEVRHRSSPWPVPPSTWAFGDFRRPHTPRGTDGTPRPRRDRGSGGDESLGRTTVVLRPRRDPDRDSDEGPRGTGNLGRRRTAVLGDRHLGSGTEGLPGRTTFIEDLDPHGKLQTGVSPGAFLTQGQHKCQNDKRDFLSYITFPRPTKTLVTLWEEVLRPLKRVNSRERVLTPLLSTFRSPTRA